VPLKLLALSPGHLNAYKNSIQVAVSMHDLAYERTSNMKSTIVSEKTTPSSLSGILLTILAVISLASIATAEEPAKVIAHITLPGTAVRQMFLQQHEDRQYLYLQQGAHFTVVDVTDPKNPTVIERVRSQGTLESIQSGLVLTMAPEKGSTAEQPGSVPTQVVNVMDLSDPKHPRTIQTFSGVTSILPDDTRKLVFIADNKGLTVLSHEKPFRRPPCTSEDAMEPDPECR
jgi:hypothetical protein